MNRSETKLTKGLLSYRLYGFLLFFRRKALATDVVVEQHSRNFFVKIPLYHVLATISPVLGILGVHGYTMYKIGMSISNSEIANRNASNCYLLNENTVDYGFVGGYSGRHVSVGNF